VAGGDEASILLLFHLVNLSRGGSNLKIAQESSERIWLVVLRKLREGTGVGEVESGREAGLPVFFPYDWQA